MEIVWDQGAIANEWLQVTLLDTDHTSLSSPDVFYFGSRLGDAASGTDLVSLTNVNDEIGVRLHGAYGVSITNVFDFDRNGLVNAADEILARINSGYLYKINVPGSPAPLAAPAATPSAGEPSATSLAAASLVPASASADGTGTAAPAADPQTVTARTSQGPRHDASVAFALATEHLRRTQAADDWWQEVDESLLDLLSAGRRSARRS